MQNTPRPDGIADPKKASQLSSDHSVDPDKFKRILKVDDSEEPAKQQNRKKSQKQEEEESLEKETDLNIPKNLAFSAFFDSSKKDEGIFKIKETEKATTQITPSEVPLPPIIPLIPSKKIAEETPSVLNLEGEISPGIRTEAEYQLSGLENSNPDNLIITPEGKVEEQNPSAQFGAPIMKKAEEEKKAEDVGVQLVAQAFIEGPALMTVETPTYAHLPKEVFEFFEKMIGLMMIESYKGISITTIRLSLPDSIFNDCEIRLEHYDTAPNSFNIQLLGTPLAVDLFNANFQSLVAAFQQPNQTFKVNIQRPILLERYQSSFKQLPPTPTEKGEQAS